jgi:P pilus assembly chaperone PapD
LQFSSLSARPRVFDVRVMRWTQRAGREVLAPDDGFIVVPAVFSIDPYQTVTVRIKPRAGTGPSIEQSEKIVVTGVVPGAATPPPTARRLEAALFVTPANPVTDAAFTLKTSRSGQADLIVDNRGNAHVYLGNVSIESAQHEIYAGTIDDYVLANSSRTFHLRVPGEITEKNADLTFDDAQGRQQIRPVTITQ